MAYQPYDRTPKGIVFFGENAADQVYESTSGFVYTSGTSTLDVPNVDVSGNLDVGGNVDVTGNGTFDGDLTVYGDLNVSGVVNQVNTTNLLVEDVDITLRSGFTGTPLADDDARIIVNRGASDDAILLWDEGVDEWKFNYGTASTYYSIREHILGGEGIDVDDSDPGSPRRTLDFNVNSISNTLTTADNTDLIAIYDQTDGTTKKISRQNFISGLGGGTVTSVGITSDTLTISGSPITSSGDIDLEVKKDGTTIDLNGSNELQIADGGVTEVKRSRTIDSSFTTGDTISSDINLVTTGASDLTINLPTAAEGKIVIIKKIDSGAGNVVISGGSHDSVTDTIDGATSKRLYYQYETLTCVAKTTGTASDVQAWYII